MRPGGETEIDSKRVILDEFAVFQEISNIMQSTKVVIFKSIIHDNLV